MIAQEIKPTNPETIEVQKYEDSLFIAGTIEKITTMLTHAGNSAENPVI